MKHCKSVTNKTHLVVDCFYSLVQFRSKMPVTLYHSSYSPPSRVALLTIRYLNIDAKIHHMDMMNGENMEEYYLKINPQHTIPTLDDNGFYLNESRAIASYLAETRAPGSALFPKDPKEQAIINQRLYYDMGTLFPKFYQFVVNILSCFCNV